MGFGPVFRVWRCRNAPRMLEQQHRTHGRFTAPASAATLPSKPWPRRPAAGRGRRVSRREFQSPRSAPSQDIPHMPRFPLGWPPRAGYDPLDDHYRRDSHRRAITFIHALTSSRTRDRPRNHPCPHLAGSVGPQRPPTRENPWAGAPDFRSNPAEWREWLQAGQDRLEGAIPPHLHCFREHQLCRLSATSGRRIFSTRSSTSAWGQRYNSSNSRRWWVGCAWSQSLRKFAAEISQRCRHARSFGLQGQLTEPSLYPLPSPRLSRANT